jgi:hypothetical protein
MKEPSDAAAVRVFPLAVPLLTILLGVAFNRLCPFNLKLSALSRYGIGGSIVGVAVLGLGLYPVILLRRTGQSENPWTDDRDCDSRSLQVHAESALPANGFGVHWLCDAP